MSTTRSRGMTLMELVVASAVGLLVMGAAYVLLVPGLRAWSTSNLRSHLRQNGLSVLARLGHDIKLSCIESLVLKSGTYHDPETGDEETAAVSMVTPLDGNGQLWQRDDGSVVWQRYLVFYSVPERREVWVGYRPLAQVGSNVQLRLEQFTPDPAQDRVIGRNVCGLGVATQLDELSRDFSSAGQLSLQRCNPVTLRIHLRDRFEDCSLSTAVSALIAADARTVTVEK